MGRLEVEYEVGLMLFGIGYGIVCVCGLYCCGIDFGFIFIGLWFWFLRLFGVIFGSFVGWVDLYLNFSVDEIKPIQ